MDTQELIALLNKALELEYQAFMQYFYQSLKLKGVSNMAFKQFLAAEADIELGHAKLLATRIAVLGGEPSSQPAAPQVGDTPEEMISYNIAREKQAIELYQQIIKAAEDEVQLYETVRGILQDELGDLDEFESLLK